MAQKILLRRGGLANLNSGATIAVTQGEQLFASGALANTNIENIIFVANGSGNDAFQAVGRLFTGTAAANSFNSRLNGLPYYKTDEEALYRLGDANALDLSGNLEGTTVAAMTITSLTAGGVNLTGDITGSNILITNNSDLRGTLLVGGDLTGSAALFSSNVDIQGTLNAVGNTTLGSDLEVTGDITGSNLYLTGNANIDGNITLGGNITIGDQTTDDITFGGEIKSDFVPDADATYDIGSPSQRWDVIYGVTGSFDKIDINGVDPTALTLQNITDNGASTDNDLTLNKAGNQTITYTGAGNFTIESTNGSVFVEGTRFTGNNVVIPGDLTVQGTTTQIDSTVVNIGDNIIVLNAAGTVADGGIQVKDTSGGTQGTGSLLWNAIDDYWYAGMSGSTHYRVTTFESQSPTQGIIPYVSGSAKRLVASPITFDDITVSSAANLDMSGNDILNVGNLSISGLDANSFTHTDASKALTTVAPSVAGDLFQWNGTAFIASNVVDGGTF